MQKKKSKKRRKKKAGKLSERKGMEESYRDLRFSMKLTGLEV